MVDERTSSTPEGTEFLELAAELEERCRAETDSKLPEMGEKAPRTLEHLGTALSLLDRAASCWWGCKEGDHLVEYLLGRTASSAAASLSLLRRGFYDESLSLSRSLGEIANLFLLFRTDRSTFEEWRKASRGERLRRFSPQPVRQALETRSMPLPITREHYSSLSELGSHITPETKPQAHNPRRRPTLGRVFQDMGVLMCLNELAYPVGVISATASALLDISPEPRALLKEQGVALVSSIGRAGVLTREEFSVVRRTAPPVDRD